MNDFDSNSLINKNNNKQNMQFRGYVSQTVNVEIMLIKYNSKPFQVMFFIKMRRKRKKCQYLFLTQIKRKLFG